MTKSSFYPPADRTTQWWEKKYVRGVFNRIDKILLHTTETTGWPGYSDGAIAPTLTYNVKTRQWRQHNYLDTSARALGDPVSTPVRENRDNVIQIEIIWYAKDAAKLPDTAYRDLAAFIAYVRQEWGGPDLRSAKFAGNVDVHMTSSEYDVFNGILGHQHAPKPSTHWDPGAIDGQKLINYVKELEKPGVSPAPSPAPSKPVVPVMSINSTDVQNIWVTKMADIVPAPNAADKVNPEWTPASYLTWGYRQGTQILEQNKKILAQQDEILALLKAQGS